MQTSVQWWNKTKNNPAKLNAWLLNQATCELNAEKKLTKLISMCDDIGGLGVKERKIVNKIAGDEGNHATWLGELCLNRGIEPKVVKTSNRYWKKAYKFKNLDEAFAVAAHAEIMRLERIKAICKDPKAPKDVQYVFKRILKDETFHAKAFTHLTSKESFVKMEKQHKAGAKALGLEL